MTTKRMGGKTVAVPSISPRCGTCGARTFLKAERFANPDEVQVSAVCDHGQGNFMDDVRTFNGAAWDLRGGELVNESFMGKSPFSLADRFPKSAKAEHKAPPPTTPPEDKAAWFRRVDALRTGDIIEGSYLPNGERSVVVSTTKGADDWRVRYRTLRENRYGTFTCKGSFEVAMFGNEHLPNEALAAGAVDELEVGDSVIVEFSNQPDWDKNRQPPTTKHEGVVVRESMPSDKHEGWIVRLTRAGVDIAVTREDIARKRCVRV